jgi:hypothetical protein
MISILKWIGVIIVCFLLLPFVLIWLYVLQPILDLVKYRNAPPGCCKTGCHLCPWGNFRFRKFRKDHLNDSDDRPMVTRSQREDVYPRFRR